jgi:GDP-L-fucose synthase
MSFYKNKKVLITGGTGMIGRQLTQLLLDQEAQVIVASLDTAERAVPGVTFLQADLRYLDQCIKVCENIDIVFQLAGIKGSPKMTHKRPASFFVPTISMSINMMEAARRCRVKNYLFTSSIGVYEPAEVFHEDAVWKTFPSENDRFAGWAKRMGELQADAYRIEYDWNNISIVRPANVYGPYDNFDPENAMVIPSLIARACSGENPLVVWGDGSAVRDFIHATDVARGMMFCLEHGITKPVNLGSGQGVSIKELVEVIAKLLPNNIDIVWDTSKPSGDKKRLMNVERIQSYGFENKVDIEAGIQQTIDWYIKNNAIANQRYNVFTEEMLLQDAE